MKDLFKVIGLGALALVLFFTICGLTGMFGLGFSRYANPFQEETRRQTYETSRSYNQGMATDLDDLCRQWRSATDQTTKSGFADTIRLRSSRYEINNLPSQVAACVREVN